MYPIKEFIETLNKIDWIEVDRLKFEIEHCNRLFILGVGGSAANASHAVNDFRKIKNIEAYAPTDNVAELTARTNDYGWETVFEDWLATSKVDKGDVVLILSVGGGSEEISKCLVTAIGYSKFAEAKVAGIVGPQGGYTAEEADVCIKIPAPDEFKTPFIEIFQSLILHFICLK